MPDKIIKYSTALILSGLFFLGLMSKLFIAIRRPLHGDDTLTESDTTNNVLAGNQIEIIAP